MDTATLLRDFAFSKYELSCYLALVANRDSLRHDFYHYFLDKIYEDKKSLTDRDKAIYEFIKRND